MANPPQRTQQVPQHVTALLSHLTSRPGVQSTLILSRKDGSIIQSTGELAIQEATARQTSLASSTADQNLIAQSSDSSPASPTAPSPTYQPSQAETLAAHITAYVSSASALGISLSKPTQTSEGSDSALNVYGTYGNGTTPQDRDADRDRDEDEVKLLRMRTRKHEIVVVPDRKYLLCVVHDAAHASAGPGPAARMR
ncbi:Dynein light chain-related protein [Penicillium atrosanguineum]|uniref:Dynein light chain-related protein n=1 Tax=Penicillium atrosanguineum TaxID=1132637 RepID=A0A9W9U652_9EURO|nr:xylose isomerase-like protein [Penicillium atrosanguineum]KAJ5122945.1 Dynein light chain-related protein [Penicillium atrosanguineum]KAJ5298168.1 xylose isomerase-like protein [Penicillium atrosanguineum]KAJ5321566.1 Dynein light chain-related protein [Penicillium atrosanguineum]